MDSFFTNVALTLCLIGSSATGYLYGFLKTIPIKRENKRLHESLKQEKEHYSSYKFIKSQRG